MTSLVESKKIKLYSFDIFETVVHRSVSAPSDIFALVEQRISFECFRELRMEAERLARKYSKYEDIRIDEIYDVFQLLTATSKEFCDNCIRIELETEIINAKGDKEVIDEIKQLVNIGERIVFISDMYLSSQDIRNILTAIDDSLSDIPIYVSSECRVTKGSGNLFKKVRDREKIAFDEWRHVGDNELSDYVVPTWLGIDALLVNKNDDGLKCQIDKKDICISNDSGKKQIKSIYDIGLYYAGPVFFYYVRWILSICERVNIQRLYFLARDGYLLKKIADIVIKSNKVNISTKYIYASRKVWYSDEVEILERKKQYIRDHVDYSDNNYAFVDLAGTGKSIRKLYNDMKDELPGIPHAFYYFFSQYDMNDGFRPFIFSEPPGGVNIEVLCRAPHGPLIDYSEVDGKMEPVLLDVGDIWVNCGIEKYIDGVIEFTKYTCDNKKENTIPYNDRLESRTHLELLIADQSRIVADFLGDMPQDDKNKEKKYAPKLEKKEIIKLFWIDQGYFCEETYRGENLRLSLNRMDVIDGLLYKLCVGQIGKIACRMYRDVRKLSNRNEKKYRVILYTAGKKGMQLKALLDTYSNIEIVAWTDMNYNCAKFRSLSLSPLAEAFLISYDYVVIPMNEAGKAYENIKSFLLNGKVDGEKIISGDKLLQILGV